MSAGALELVKTIQSPATGVLSSRLSFSRQRLLSTVRMITFSANGISISDGSRPSIRGTSLQSSLARSKFWSLPTKRSASLHERANKIRRVKTQQVDRFFIFASALLSWITILLSLTIKSIEKVRIKIKMAISPELLEILRCPKCKSRVELKPENTCLKCVDPECGLVYPIKDDIPVMLIDEATVEK